jgi:hypothetical protein
MRNLKTRFFVEKSIRFIEEMLVGAQKPTPLDTGVLNIVVCDERML